MRGTVARSALVAAAASLCRQPLAVMCDADRPARAEAVAQLLDQLTSLHNAGAPSERSGFASVPAASWAEIGEAEAELFAETRELGATSSEYGALYSRAATDGELLDDGVATMLATLAMDEECVFADLGSGLGGLLARVSAAAPLRACYGIEFVAAKHAAADRLLGRSAPHLQSPVQLLRGDLIEIGAWARGEQEGAEGEAIEHQPQPPGASAAPLRHLTHAFACSVCFDDFLLRRMAASLGDAAVFPHFQVLISLRELPSQPHLVRVGSLPFACTWNAAAQGHVYVPADLLQRRRQGLPTLERLLCRSGVCTLPPELQWPEQSFLRLPR
jgi:hypothetical protein